MKQRGQTKSLTRKCVVAPHLAELIYTLRALPGPASITAFSPGEGQRTGQKAPWTKKTHVCRLVHVPRACEPNDGPILNIELLALPPWAYQLRTLTQYPSFHLARKQNRHAIMAFVGQGRGGVGAGGQSFCHSARLPLMDPDARALFAGGHHHLLLDGLGAIALALDSSEAVAC